MSFLTDRRELAAVLWRLHVYSSVSSRTLERRSADLCKRLSGRNKKIFCTDEEMPYLRSIQTLIN